MDFIRQLNKFEPYKKVESFSASDGVYKYKFAFPFERIRDPHFWTVDIFQRYWYHGLTISILYIMLVKALQKAMANRKPFSLERPLLVWNGSLAVFSMLGTLRMSEDIFSGIYKHGILKNFCTTSDLHDVAAFWILLFTLSKIVELGDTVFIVLRKRRLIFLHCYHHAAVLIYSLHTIAEHGTPGRCFVLMNFFAHSLMYSYYAAKAYGCQPPRWVPMTVTVVQTTQMLTGVAISWTVYKIKTRNWMPCQQSMGNLYLAFTIYTTFAALFIQYFYRTYIVKVHRNKKESRRNSTQKQKGE